MKILHWLTEDETAALMKLAVGRVLPLVFGPRGVAIQQTPDSQWACDELQRMRDITSGRLIADGGGI